MTESHEITIDISYTPQFDGIQYYEKLISKDCRKISFVGKLLSKKIIKGKSTLVGDSTLRLHNLFYVLERRSNLCILDFSSCEDATEIKAGSSGIYDLSIEEIILPPKVKQLPYIQRCTNLVRIVGKGLTQIPYPRISKCPLLEKIVSCEALTDVYVPNTNIRGIDISEVENIRSGAFENCRNLEYVKLSSKLKSLGKDAFKNCVSLYEIDIPDYCEIAESAFCGCSSLHYLRLPNTLTKLNKNTFANCTNLQFVTGGENIQEICSGAFLNCKKLKRLPFAPKVIDENAFEESSKDYYGFEFGTYGVIWCFNTLSFYKSKPVYTNDRDRLVKFTAGKRITFNKSDNSIDINYYPCQIANDVCYDFDVKDSYMKKAIESFRFVEHSIPRLSILSKSIEEKISKLDIKSIVSGYHTSIEEFQTWKVGGDNTFYLKKKTSFVYTDVYLEQFLPIYNQEYSESACHDYSDEIDPNAQSKQNVIDSELRNKVLVAYNKEDHIKCLMDSYLKSYMEHYRKVQEILHFEFAKKVLRDYGSCSNQSCKQLLCSVGTPPLQYKEWFDIKYQQLFPNG